MSVIEALLEYQDIDKEIADMNHEILMSDAGKEKIIVKKKGNQILEDLVKVDKQCSNAIKEYNELEKELNNLTVELEDYEGIENDMVSREQSEYNLNKIKDLIARIDVVMKKINENNAIIDKNIKIADKLRDSYNKNNADAVQANANLVEFRKPYLAKFNELTAKQAELEKIVGDELIEKYKSLRKRYTTGKVVVELKGDDKNGWSCMGCFLESTAADVRMKETGKEIVECQSCGRLVYKKK